MKKVLVVITNIEERTSEKGKGKYFHISSKTEDGLRVGLNLSANENSVEVIKKLAEQEKLELNIDEEKISKSTYKDWSGTTVSAKVKDNFEMLESFGLKRETVFERFVKTLSN